MKEGNLWVTLLYVFFRSTSSTFHLPIIYAKKNQRTDAVFWKFCIIYTDRHLNEHFKTH